MLIHDDVRTLTARLVRDRLGCLPSVIVGSPPCQDASLANTKGRGVDGERTGLFFEAIRLVDEIRPVWGCFENVPGIRTRGADRVCAALEEIGYTVWPLVVGAWHAGAPHRRNRVWFVFAADAAQERWRERWPGRPDSGHAGQQQQPLQSAHATDTDGNGWANGRTRRRIWSDVQAEASSNSFIRDVERAWPGWNGGLVEACPLDDGLPDDELLSRIAAYGDAVVPQITEAIGRAMMRLCPTDGTVLDLFTGAAGGWSFGMERAGYRTVAVCEFDPWRRSVLAERCAA